MRVLAIDPGTKMGWALGKSGSSEVLSGTWDLSLRRGDSSGMRYVYLRKKLTEILAAYPDLEMVITEQAHNRGGHATEVLNGLVTHVQSWCAEHNITKVTSVHSSTLKKSATGKGNASKEEMIQTAIEKGWNPKDDNEADALHILDYALHEVVDK